MMKPLPSGNYALFIAHPGHELRLHGFLEQAKPFVFILTDDSEARGEDLMWDAVKSVDRATKHGMTIRPDQLAEPFMRKVLKMSIKQGEGEEKDHIKDSQILYEATNLHTEFLKHYIDFMVENLIKYKINYLVCDSSEESNFTHDMVRMLSDLAILKVKQRTGDDIVLYDFAINTPYNSIQHEYCIHVKLDEQAVQRKLHAICVFPLAIKELAPNIYMDMDEINTLRKKNPRSFLQKLKDWAISVLILFQLMDKRKIPHEEQFVFLKKALLEQNPDFFANEYLRPARMFKETDNYKTYIRPIYGKLLKEITQ